MIIRPEDRLEKLVEAGILPQWIADDALPHGMDEAQYILNEYDWEWGWDLGDGYNEEQWEVLKEARRKIQDGIREYYANIELVAQDKERTDLQKAILMRIGVTCSEPMSEESIKKAFPDLSDKTIKSLAYHNWPLYKTYKTLVEDAVATLPSPIPEEEDPYWIDLIESQRLDGFGMTPGRLRRLMTFFSLNKKTQVQKRKGSAGIY